MTLLESVRTNDRRAALVSLRDSIAATIDGTDSARDVAALAKRLMEVMREIDALPDQDADESPIDRAKKARKAK